MIYDNTEFIEPFDLEEVDSKESDELILDILYALLFIVTNDQSQKSIYFQTRLQNFMEDEEDNELI